MKSPFVFQLKTHQATHTEQPVTISVPKIDISKQKDNWVNCYFITNQNVQVKNMERSFIVQESQKIENQDFLN